MFFSSLFKKPKAQAESFDTVNYEGAGAFTLTPEMELYTAVVTCALSDKFYETASDQVNRILSLITRVSPEFVAKLAVYTRTQMQLRSVPLFLAVALAKTHSGDDLVARTVEKVVLRADEIMELLACYQALNPSSGVKKLGKLSHQIQEGLRRAFNRFDEYQFAKYNRSGIPVTLRDALFLVHPKAKDEAQQALFDKIVSGTLSVPYTWETELSALGERDFASDGERAKAFRLKWEELVGSGKMGYMATLRNLRNMLQAGVSTDTVKAVCRYLSDERNVMASKQLPFRFFSAYREVEKTLGNHASAVLEALDTAMKASAANIAGFDADTRALIACDVSGSMYSPVSRNSSVRCFDVGLVLGMLLRSRLSNAITGMFGDTWKAYNLPKGRILRAVSEMERHEGEVGYSTNGFEVLKWMRANNVTVDKVMFFTDCQMWNSTNSDNTFAREWSLYKRLNPKAEMYIFDLVGYGQAPLRVEQNGVYLIGGWSDRIFDICDAIRHGASAIDVINAIEL